MIQIGIPSKGRLHEPIVALLKQSGYRFRHETLAAAFTALLA